MEGDRTIGTGGEPDPGENLIYFKIMMQKWSVWFANTHEHLMHISSGWNTENITKETHSCPSLVVQKTLLQWILSQRRNFCLGLDDNTPQHIEALLMIWDLKINESIENK